MSFVSAGGAFHRFSSYSLGSWFDVGQANVNSQLEFWNESGEPIDYAKDGEANGDLHRTTSQPRCNESKYVSIKRVSLVYDGSIEVRPNITSTQQAKDFFAKYWQDNPAADQEKFVVALLDTKHRVQSVVVVTTGTLDASLVHPREVFKPAILEGSSAVILSHNHPSGDTTPSREDHAVTEQLTEAGKLIGITVLDHIIFGDATGEVVSIREC